MTIGSIDLPMSTSLVHAEYDFHREAKAMREVSELLSKKELELNNLAKQVEHVSREIEALRTTMRLLEQAGASRPVIQESVKRPTISLRTDNGSRETEVAELP